MGLDAASDIVEHLPGQPFVMLVNVGAVDSAAEPGANGYLQTVKAWTSPWPAERPAARTMCFW